MHHQEAAPGSSAEGRGRSALASHHTSSAAIQAHPGARRIEKRTRRPARSTLGAKRAPGARSRPPDLARGRPHRFRTSVGRGSRAGVCQAGPRQAGFGCAAPRRPSPTCERILLGIRANSHQRVSLGFYVGVHCEHQAVLPVPARQQGSPGFGNCGFGQACRPAQPRCAGRRHATSKLQITTSPTSRPVQVPECRSMGPQHRQRGRSHEVIHQLSLRSNNPGLGP